MLHQILADYRFLNQLQMKILTDLLFHVEDINNETFALNYYRLCYF